MDKHLRTQKGTAPLPVSTAPLPVSTAPLPVSTAPLPVSTAPLPAVRPLSPQYGPSPRQNNISAAGVRYLGVVFNVCKKY
jgi:hypothetical protein